MKGGTMDATSIRRNVHRSILYLIDTQAGGSTSAFAKEVGADRQKVNHWKNGRNAPDLEKLGEIARHYHLSLDWMIGGDLNKAPDGYMEYYVVNFADDESEEQ